MIFGKTKVELKVGVFVFLGALILAAFILSIGSFRTWTSGRTVNFVFHFINGVKLGAPVRYAGMDVGEVKSLSIINPEVGARVKVKVGCWVKKDIKIPLDSSVWVNTLGLLGEKYIEIIPGEDFSSFLEDDCELAGIDPVSMQEVTELANKIVKSADSLLLRIQSGEGTIGKLLWDDRVYEELEALMRDVRRNPWKLFWKTREKK